MAADDQTLLRRTHAGHEPSAREMWSRHAGWMAAYARSVLGPRGRSMADDVVQSVFCRLLGLDRRTVRQVREVRPWLARVTRHEALNHLRTAHRAARRELEAGHRTLQTSPHPETRYETGHDTGHDLAAALAGLPRRFREVAYLRHVVGLSVDETATALGVPRGTVASRNHAAMQRLRDMLKSTPRPASVGPDPAGSTPLHPSPDTIPPAAEPFGAPHHAQTH